MPPPVKRAKIEETYKPPSKVEETEEVESSDDDDPFVEIDSDDDDDFENSYPPGYYERISVLKKSGRYDYEADGDKMPYGRPILQLHEDCNRLRRINLGYFSVLALQKYNRDNQANYKFVRVVKACVRCCAGFMYFITFEAVVDAPSDFETFQAQVWNGVGKDRVNLCRLRTTDVRNLPSFGNSETDHHHVDFHKSETDKDVFDFDLDPKDHMRDVTILNLETDALNLQTDAYYIVSRFANVAIHQFNWINTTHGRYSFAKVVKAMMRDNKYYITFEAEDRNSDEEGAKIFRALVWYKEGSWKTISVRPKPAN